MAGQMEKLGFDCTGVERNREAADFAERIRVATESRYRIWRGNLSAFPDPTVDVVLALNVFHHLIKTHEGHESLVKFLQRLSTETIFFEPHVPERSFRQMESAYRNYAPDEFAEFVATHSGLATIDFLGRAADERPLYALRA
jgi:hypothetical protein